MLTAAALLHPDVSPKAVDLFCNRACNISIQENLDNSSDAVLIFGGDGTVHRHLPWLRQARVPLLVVPKGSGNDFAQALGIAGEKAALRAWREFCSTGTNVREIDLGIVVSGQTEIPFCCVVGVGFDADANARANRMPAWLRGTAGYLVGALQALAWFQPAEFTVSAGGGVHGYGVHGYHREIRRSGFFVAVGNAHRYGRGMKIAPRAVLDDGLLDVCFVGRMSRLKLLLAIPTVFFGAHLGIRQVEYFQASAVRVDAGRPLEVYADGEYACPTPAEIKLIPAGLRVIVPA